MGKIIRIFLDTHMAMQHDGLREIARKNKVDVTNFGVGEHAVFVNKARTRLKVFSAGGVLSYISRPKGVSLETLQYIPEAFEGKRLNYERAVTAHIRKKWEQRVDKNDTSAYSGIKSLARLVKKGEANDTGNPSLHP